MDTHSRSAQDLLPSGAQSHETDELEHEAVPERPAPPPSHAGTAHEPVQGRRHAEEEAEAASLPLGDSFEAPLSMPGEHEAAFVAPASPTAPASATRPSTRNLLLGTALAVALMAGGGGIYVLSHRGHAVQMATTPPQAWRPDQATRNPADPVAALTASPFSTSVHHAEQAPGGADDILALRHENAARPAAAVASAPKAAPPGVITPPVAPLIVVPPPTVVVAAPAHPDPVATALALRPAPMTQQQQVDVLSVVTEMAALVRDIRTENAQLRDKVASLDSTVKNEASDISGRLSLMEAHKAIASAQEAGKPQPPAVPGTGVKAPVAVVQTVAVRSTRDYRVQAASPGLAILADANAAPGQSAGLQVAVGDQVPGVGRITSIAQRGTAWVVQTNHGAIQ